jgi:ubiquinone/menaquinone biosynthesis C-methylase UbiE
MSLEIGSGTGRFAEALQIREGIEPSANMKCVAEKRGVNTLGGIAEDLPYGDLQFDVVLMNSCMSYLKDPDRALKEVFRVLKYGGCLLLGFIDSNSLIGRYYESKRANSVFYRNAVFFNVGQVQEKLKNAGFRQMTFSQTLFHSLDETNLPEPVKSGFGEGSYVLVKAIKLPWAAA